VKANKKNTKNLEAVQARISVLRYEIAVRKEELEELANHLADFELSLNVDIRGLKDEFGIVATGWSI
jgi:predicted RNase H-like nuclease (RuvC/YqgF family)